MSILLWLVLVYFYQVLMCFVALSISSSTFWIYKPIYNFINDIKTGFLELK
jgi:hypothetical protein